MLVKNGQPDSKRTVFYTTRSRPSDSVLIANSAQKVKQDRKAPLPIMTRLMKAKSDLKFTGLKSPTLAARLNLLTPGDKAQMQKQSSEKIALRPSSTLMTLSSGLKTAENKFASPAKMKLNAFSQFVKGTFDILKSDSEQMYDKPVQPVQPTHGDSPEEPLVDFDDLPEIEETKEIAIVAEPEKSAYRQTFLANFNA